MVLRPGPSFSVADVCRGWVNGLREAGCEVADVNLDDRLTYFDLAEKALELRAEEERFPAAITMVAQTIRGDLFDFAPDVLVVVSGFFVPVQIYDLARARGIKVVLLNTESPYEDDRQLARSSHVDVVVLNDPTNLDAFRAINPNSHYFPHCYDPAIHSPGPVEHADHVSDFVFVGTGYPSRREFFEKVDWSGIDAAFAGNWQGLDDSSPLAPFLVNEKQFCLDNDDAVKLYRATKVSANLYRKETTALGTADGWACGPREVELAATGTFFLREPRGESDELFGFLPTFTTPTEFEDLLRYFLDAPDERMALAARARDAIGDRTFVNSAKRLLSLI